MGGAWTNDQLNSIFIYAASNGMLILSVDQNGLYLANTADGSYFRAESRPSTIGNQDIITLELQPPNSVVPGVTFGFGEILAAEAAQSSTKTFPEIQILSPQVIGKASAAIYLAGQDNTAATDNSSIGLDAPYLYGINANIIGEGICDTALGTFTANPTATEVALDYVGPNIGLISATRLYDVCFGGSVASTVAGDTIGLRLYSSTSNTSLTGATLLQDFGQVTVAKASTPQPFPPLHFMVQGNATKYVVLGVRRATGTGTCTVTTNYRRYDDLYSLV